MLAVYARYRGRIEDLRGQLRRASGFAFYSTSRYDFEKLLADSPHIAQNLRHYIAGFSANMCEVLEKFELPETRAPLARPVALPRKVFIRRILRPRIS